MKVIAEKPPEWIMQGCLNQFRVNVEHTFWTYGDTIYNPGGHAIPADILAHEEQHGRQQEAYPGGKDAWWKQYLVDAEFRKGQEADAYATQYKYFCSIVHDRNRRAMCLMQLGQQLSSSLYQIAISQLDARKLIQVLAGEILASRA